MKRLCVIMLLAVLPLCGGCQREYHFFDVFSNGYSAEIKGTLYDLEFAAEMQAQKVNDAGIQPLTITFYAPETLLDTVITRDEAGNVKISYQDFEITPENGWQNALFSLFPTTGKISNVTLDENKYTVIEGDGFFVTFLEDGTPIAAKNADIDVSVVKFSTK